MLSLPDFYGAHGYDPKLPEMSAIFFAAGPHVCRHELDVVRNIDATRSGKAISGPTSSFSSLLRARSDGSTSGRRSSHSRTTY